ETEVGGQRARSHYRQAREDHQLHVPPYRPETETGRRREAPVMSMNREAKELYQDQVTRWRRLWAVTFGALILVLGSGAVTVNLLLDASRVRNRELSQIDQVIQEISDNQAGIDELVS